MENLKEFLESTTIHGLSYIATCRSKIGKVGWLLAVTLCFGCAGYLIQSAFSDWADSPVSTTITPHPVAHLPFPDVTICPPKGLNSALKYDLMMTANMTLNVSQTDKLMQGAKKAFGRNAAKTFAENMQSLVNKENLEKVFEGFIGFPEETDQGFLMRLTGVEGSIQSPGYGQNFSLDQFRLVMGRQIHYQLDIKDRMDKKSTLMIEVQVDGEVEGKMTINDAKFTAFENKLSWNEAEAFCVSGGGHLATVASEIENASITNDSPIEIARINYRIKHSEVIRSMEDNGHNKKLSPFIGPLLPIRDYVKLPELNNQTLTLGTEL